MTTASSTTTRQTAYSAQAAAPQLASSLLSSSFSLSKIPRSAVDTAPSQSWSLSSDLRRGIVHTYRTDERTREEGDEEDAPESSRHRHIFRSGTVLGVSWLKDGGGAGGGGAGNVNMSMNQSMDRLGEFSRQLVAATLLQQHEHNQRHERIMTQKMKTFIIHHASSTTFAPESLLQAILKPPKPAQPQSEPEPESKSESESESRAKVPITTDRAISLLDEVHLIPVFDFAGAVQAIGQVVDEVHRLVTISTTAATADSTTTQEAQAQAHNDAGDDNVSENGSDARADEDISPCPPLITIIIEGLDTLTENIIKASTAMRGTAMLLPVLRTLTHVSRMYPDLVAVMLVNLLGLGGGWDARGAGGAGAGGAGAGGRGDGAGGDGAGIAVADDGGLRSVFTRSSAVSGSKSSTSTGGTSLCPSLLLKTVDQGVDVHLMVSSNTLMRGGTQGQGPVTAVEVIKDRVGGNVGRWCVWE